MKVTFHFKEGEKIECYFPEYVAREMVVNKKIYRNIMKNCTGLDVEYINLGRLDG